MLNTGGGTVTGYGLAAAQLVRIKQGGLPLTICVEQVMSACRNRALTGGEVRCLNDSPNLSRARSYSPPWYASEAHEEENTGSRRGKHKEHPCEHLITLDDTVPNILEHV